MTPPLDRATIAAHTTSLIRLDDPADEADRLRLMRTLYATGRRDLPLGRIVEGHVDALQIIARYGSPAQRETAHGASRAGALFGVWNADLPGEPLTIAEGRLSGGKAFASGGGLLSHALVTADVDGARQLLLIDLGAAPPAIDRSWWRVSGMQRSETHIVRWKSAVLPEDAFIGAPGDYVREPWFSGGALRFCAVQAGGIAAVVDHARALLANRNRAADPHQAGRLIDLYLAAQSAADAVRTAASAWSPSDPAATLALVAAARVAVYQAGERVLSLAQAAIGVQAMFLGTPLAEILSDLAMYLRQPGPDAQRQRGGEAVAAGLLRPAL